MVKCYTNTGEKVEIKIGQKILYTKRHFTSIREAEVVNISSNGHYIKLDSEWVNKEGIVVRDLFHKPHYKNRPCRKHRPVILVPPWMFW